jgi:hypothetical protein
VLPGQDDEPIARSFCSLAADPSRPGVNSLMTAMAFRLVEDILAFNGTP